MEFHDEEVISSCPYSAIVPLPTTMTHFTSFAKIVLIQSGSCTLNLNDKKGKIIESHHLNEGDVFIICAYQPHTYIIDKDKNYIHRDIYLSMDMLKEYSNFLKADLFNEINGKLPRIFHLSPPSLIYFVERASFLLGKEKNILKDSIHKSLVIDLLAHYVTYKDEEAVRPIWINALLRKIDEESFISLPIKEMVVTTNYSHGYVNREFKKYMNCSLKHYVNNRKLEWSSIMLATSDISLQQIVIKLNFTTTSSFISLFKEKFGITPGQYRKRQNKYISLDKYTNWGLPRDR